MHDFFDFFLIHRFETEMNRSHNPLKILISENISQIFICLNIFNTM